MFYALTSLWRGDRAENSIMQTISIAVSAILIAAGLVTAPGLINNARDNNAVLDLSNIAFTQEFALANKGKYYSKVEITDTSEESLYQAVVGDADFAGIKYNLSGEVTGRKALTCPAPNSAYLLKATSKSGKTFFRSSASATTSSSLGDIQVPTCISTNGDFPDFSTPPDTSNPNELITNLMNITSVNGGFTAGKVSSNLIFQALPIAPSVTKWNKYVEDAVEAAPSIIQIPNADITSVTAQSHGQPVDIEATGEWSVVVVRDHPMAGSLVSVQGTGLTIGGQNTEAVWDDFLKNGSVSINTAKGSITVAGNQNLSADWFKETPVEPEEPEVPETVPFDTLETLIATVNMKNENHETAIDLQLVLADSPKYISPEFITNGVAGITEGADYITEDVLSATMTVNGVNYDVSQTGWGVIVTRFSATEFRLDVVNQDFYVNGANTDSTLIQSLFQSGGLLTLHTAHGDLKVNTSTTSINIIG